MPLVEITVPLGSVPGQKLQMQLGGQVIDFVVPPGVRPGSKLRINVPDVPDAPPSAAPHQNDARAPADATAGVEKMGVVVATVVGFFGVIAALVMLHNLEIGGEGTMVAAICLAAAGVMSARLRKDFRDREEHRELKPSEDTTMGVVMGLCHAAVVALSLQVHYSFLDDESRVPDETVLDAVGYVEGTRPLFAAQLFVHLVLLFGQAAFLLGFGKRYPAFAPHSPRGGFTAWLVCSCVPIVLLFIGFGMWDSLTCEEVYRAAADDDTDDWIGNMDWWTPAPELVDRSPECDDAAAVFTLVAGAILILTTVGLTQASNRGWLAVWSLPVLATIVMVWSAASRSETRLSPMLILLMMAVWVSLLACFTGGGSSARWSEATTTSFAAALLICQIATALPNPNPVHLNLVDQAEEGFFTSTPSVLWLAQFVFLPVVILNRAGFPVVMLIAGAGLLQPPDTLFTIPIVTVVGLITIKLTAVGTEERLVSMIGVQGFNLGLEEQAEQLHAADDPNNNSNRVLACCYLTPALAFTYLVSSWTSLARGDNLWVSALLVVCPAVLGGAQIFLHDVSPNLAVGSISLAVILTAGPWFDDSLTLLFSLLWVPLLIIGRLKVAKVRTEDGPDIASLTPLHWCCSLAILLFISTHNLSLAPIQPWLYTVGLYIFCFELPTSRSESPTTRPLEQLLSSSRLLRPGMIGPLLCVVPSTFWTIHDQHYVCDLDARQDGTCNESAVYQLFMVLPIVIILIEWACDEIRATRDNTRMKQTARTAALVWFVVCAVPFRYFLWVSTNGLDDYLNSRSYENRQSDIYANCTACSDNSGVYQTDLNCRDSFSCDCIDWCDFKSLDDDTMKESAFVYSVLLASGPILLAAISGLLYSRDPDESGVADYVAGVPPTQEMAMALLLTALLDYFTPLLAAPVCFAACYMSYVGFTLTRDQGAWPTGMLAAVLVWLIKSAIGYFDPMTRALWGVQILGIAPSIELVQFNSNFDSWWPPMMGAVLLAWGGFVRLKLVATWPQDSEGSEFSWERLMYIVDALVFYCAVLLMADLSGGWICVVLCTGACAWGLHQQDVTLVMRLPALFLTSFLVLEHFQGWGSGTVSFFATSVACIVAAILTQLLFRPTEAEEAQRDGVSGIVDITFLWAFVIAFLDNDGGVTHGGLAFGLSLALVPFLHFRGYPLLLAGVPLALPITLLYFLDNLNLESSDIRLELIASLMGCATAVALVLLSLIKISPPIAGDASDFTSMGATMDKRQYHAFLHWAGTGWMYIWIVFGFYVTRISIPGALVGTLVIGVTNLTLGIQNNSMLLRMSGLTELCVGIFLGGQAPGVNGFVQAILVLVGSIFALGSAGMYFYWRKAEQSDEMRPASVTLDDSAFNEPGSVPAAAATMPAATMPVDVTPTRTLIVNPMSTVADEQQDQQDQQAQLEQWRQFDQRLAASDLGSSSGAIGGGGNSLLLDALLQASGMAGQFNEEQTAAISMRLAEAASTILREASHPMQTLIVATERLNVRAAPNANAHILRKLPRNAMLTVLGPPYHATDGSEWRELTSTEGQGSAPPRAWVCASQRGTGGRRQNFLHLAV